MGNIDLTEVVTGRNTREPCVRIWIESADGPWRCWVLPCWRRHYYKSDLWQRLPFFVGAALY